MIGVEFRHPAERRNSVHSLGWQANGVQEEPMEGIEIAAADIHLTQDSKMQRRSFPGVDGRDQLLGLIEPSQCNQALTLLKNALGYGSS